MSEDRAPYGSEESFSPARDKITVAFDNNGPIVMIVAVPIEHYADDKENGAAMVYGKMREVEAIAMRELVGIRARKASASGILRPGTNGMKVT